MVPGRPPSAARLGAGQKAALYLGVPVALLLLCCGGLTAIGLATDERQPSQPATGERWAGNSVDAPVAATQSGASQPAASGQPSASSQREPVVETRRETQTQQIPFQTKTVEDATLAEGTQKIKTAGVPGTKTLVYEVTLIDGAQTDKKLISETVTKAPVTQVVAIGTKQAQQCHASYSGACVPIASDVDCLGGSGNGPAYVQGPVKVIGPDVYGLDNDGDGVGCE